MLSRMTLLATTTLIAAFAWTSDALAFEPISFKEAPSVVGKAVYLSFNLDLESGEPLFAGDEVTLVEAQPGRPAGDGATFGDVTIKTKDGRTAVIDISRLSKTPLKYKLRDPGPAAQLIVKVTDDAIEHEKKRHALEAKYRYSIDSTAHADDYYQSRAMMRAAKFSRWLVHNLVFGSNRSKSTILQDKENRWLVLAKDEKFLSWYENGIQNAALKSKLTNADLIMQTLDNISSHEGEIARTEQEKQSKHWLKGLDGIPAAKVAQIDREKVAALDARIRELEGFITKGLAEVTTLRAKLR